MRVICIDNSDHKNNLVPIIPEGEVVTVYGEFDKNSWFISEYQMATNGDRCAYVKTQFIPLSEIDETELIKERELVNA